ncbi:hypothetical protein CDD82_2839 [Ophiocordyceps australis]|uniref:Uncharacterized protein n=1 Tax=Ophiocordyceps australis TaxID=1399860 RepID=A0A2C5X6W7_9HYPO|nr:hypothetical protein CDD82_2839 [Ophiocordyceps australis]
MAALQGRDRRPRLNPTDRWKLFCIGQRLLRREKKWCYNVLMQSQSRTEFKDCVAGMASSAFASSGAPPFATWSLDFQLAIRACRARYMSLNTATQMHINIMAGIWRAKRPRHMSRRPYKAVLQFPKRRVAGPQPQMDCRFSCPLVPGNLILKSEQFFWFPSPVVFRNPPVVFRTIMFMLRRDHWRRNCCSHNSWLKMLLNAFGHSALLATPTFAFLPSMCHTRAPPLS